jgi:UDP-glucuronate decarboxylase
MIRMMESRADFTGPVNIGNPGEFSMLQLAELIIKMTGSKSKLIFKPLPQDDPKQRRPDITLAANELAWAPTIDLEAGLEKTISYFTQMV